MMKLRKNRIGQNIVRIWDASSETYDTQQGHGIQGGIEREVWENIFKRLLSQGRLEVKEGRTYALELRNQ
ncbi:hypothetical protein RG963_15830 [Methanosarcina sp. Z-7115]|uniref:Uncharacterized protein n=1 Tax=Methanosarcina baikalica TaxID=3073890 RepID=A0ABU2D5E4_9EURY|nr:hypothetical protein [Methanosarcina sp. Z-7115]MDR7667215.1 hypothetical protein [Methanosarcina sp. Z-7115]